MGICKADHFVKNRSVAAVLGIACILLSSVLSTAQAEDLELRNRPVNASGLTGLIYTTSPFVLPSGTIEISGLSQSENSFVPSYSLTDYALSVSAGILGTAELSVKGDYYSYNPNATGARRRDFNDTELSVKWNLRGQAEYSLAPAVSLIGGTAYPSKNRDGIESSVDHWSAWCGVAVGEEVLWDEHVIGIYADVRVHGQDLSDRNGNKDVFLNANVGMLSPISKTRNLQMLVEYNVVNRKDVIVRSGGDYNAITYGLRLVNERFNLTIGTQFLHKKVNGFDDSSRIIGMLSVKL